MSVPGAQRHHMSAMARGARESRIDVDDRGAAFAGLDHPPEADRMVLGHRRAHDQDRVGVRRSCCAVVAPPRPNEVPRPGTVELCHIRA